MPHMDMEMADHSSTDYSDFEVQTLTANLGSNNNPSSGGSTRLSAHQRLEPLGDRGGLDNNEEAELVYFELHASLEWDDEGGDQNVGTAGEYRGQFGANFAETEADLADVNSGLTGDGDSTILDESNTGNTFANLGSKTDNTIFAHWRAIGAPPFDDQTNGPGGSANSTVYTQEKAFREVMGRGPVLDSQDDLTILHAANVGDTVIDFSGVVKILMIWDIAETDESGAEFSPTV